MENYETWDLSVHDCILLLGGSAAAGAGTGWLFYDRPGLGLLLGALLFLLAKPRYVLWQVERRKRTLLLQFRDVLYSVSSCVSAGRSLGQALEESIGFWKGTYGEKDLIIRELAGMVRRMKEGNERDIDVLKDFAARCGLQDVSDFAMVCENCRESGADLVRAIDRATEVIGDRIELERELTSMMVQKQFEGRIIMAAPFLLLLFLKITSPDFLLPLTSSPAGMMVSSLALGLILAAVLMMERVNRIAF